MTLGVESIGVFIPECRVSNYDRLEQFGLERDFLEQKIGIAQVAVKEPAQKASDLCVAAFAALEAQAAIDRDGIDAVVVVTQNPDTNLPHTSAILHGKLGLSEDCACFDVSLGCSGYVYGLSVLASFLERNSMRRGLLFTADPYSDIIAPDDRNTALLFGDAATVTVLGERPVVTTGRFTFGTLGKQWEDLACTGGRLRMNGRAIFTFAATCVPRDVRRVLERNNLRIEDVDVFLFHQGSRFVVDTISGQLGLDPGKVVFDIADYGNSVSSSLPIILQKCLAEPAHRVILLSGFGVGLSWASTILYRVAETERA